MKYKPIAMFMVFVLLSSLVYAQFWTGFMNDITVNPEIPASTDSVLVKVSGELPNACYSVKWSKTRVLGNSVYVDIFARYNSRLHCLDMPVDWELEENIGKLEQGHYYVITTFHLNRRPQETRTSEFDVSGPVCDPVMAEIQVPKKKITLSGDGRLTVRVESQCFDARLIDRSSIDFEGIKPMKKMSITDKDKDGIKELSMTFRKKEIVKYACENDLSGSVQIKLTGQVLPIGFGSEMPFEGYATMNFVGSCK